MRKFYVCLMSTAIAATATGVPAQGRLPPCPGPFNATTWTDCFGTYTWPDGQKYVGEWKGGKLGGQGISTFPDGGKYVGEFRQGEKDGQGSFTYPNGNTYVGAWRNGSPNGQGTATFANGEKHAGEWRDGKLYAGEYKDGVPDGRGTMRLPDGRMYVGAFRHGKYDGRGTYTWPDGQKYVGEYRDDKRNGHGTYTWPNGEKYVGQFRDNNAYGRGTHTYPDGRQYVGEFRNGRFHGQGTFTNPDGRKYAGEWKDGRPAAEQRDIQAKAAIPEPSWQVRLTLWRKKPGERTAWRGDPRLRGRFHADAPDDIQVLFLNPGAAAGQKNEVMWATVIEHDPGTDLFLGILLNAPRHLRDVAEGDNVVFRFDSRAQALVAVSSAGGHRAAALPRTRSPDFLEAIVSGVRAYRQGRFGHNMPGIEQCIRILSPALHAVPAAATVDERFAGHFVLARCLAEKYETTGAIEHFKAAIKLDSNDVDAQMGLLAELSHVIRLNARMRSRGEQDAWDSEFLEQLSLVKRRFAQDRTVQAVMAALFDESKAAEMKLSEADILHNRQYGFGAFRWKRR